MFDRFIIFFFYFFLISRFFSEKLRILPKWIDVINFGLFFILLILLFYNLKKKDPGDNGEKKFLSRIIMIFTITFFISVIVLNHYLTLGATALFYIGFMEGPLLFIAIDKLSKYPLKLAQNVNKLFIHILLINFIIIFAVDIPLFLITGSPDVVSGSYGNNTYQFSMLLLICGSYLIGYNYIKKSRTWIVIITQILILVIFYISQFRSGLPFFVFSYLSVIGFLYGKKIIMKMIPITFFLMILIYIVLYVTEREKYIEDLRFNEWMEIIAEPGKYLDYGKFKIYQNIPAMWIDEPLTFVFGAGPGNFMSRANYTFTSELSRSDKGVSLIIKDIFGIQYPKYSDLHNKYIRNSIKSESIFGTWQLANPYTSYLSAIAEIGIIGGISIIILYLYLIKKSFEFFKIIKNNKQKYIPLSISLIGGTIYLFGLAFLENYWEIARVTLPVWLLFWAVKTVVYSNETELSKENSK